MYHLNSFQSFIIVLREIQTDSFSRVLHLNERFDIILTVAKRKLVEV